MESWVSQLRYLAKILKLKAHTKYNGRSFSSS